MERAGLAITMIGTLMAVLATGLLLYTAALILTETLLPALRTGEVGLAQASILGFDFSGYGVLVPFLAYLLMGFLALALGIRQLRRARQIWQEGKENTD